MNQALPSSVTSIKFTDDTGKQLTLAAFKGKAVVFTPFMTLCQETCPLTTSNLQQLDKSVIKAHQENNVQMVMITIDPARDTVARLHAYRSVAQITQPNWTLLTAVARRPHHDVEGARGRRREDRRRQPSRHRLDDGRAAHLRPQPH